MKTSSTPYWRNHHDVNSGFQENSNISEMVIVREKNYHTPLIGSWGQSFRIDHPKLLTASPGGEIVTTLFPVSKEASRCRKWCVIEQKPPL
jgi:hypothetical protein